MISDAHRRALKRHLVRTIKAAHTLSGVGMAGGLAAYMLLLQGAPDALSTEQYFALRSALAVVSGKLLLPAMFIALASGLIAIALNETYINSAWPWIKALTGILLFEATLTSLDGPAQRAAGVAAKALDEQLPAEAIAGLMQDEWGAWWMLLIIMLVNIILGIWRPRFLKPLPKTGN